MEPYITLVDTNDRVIGKAPKIEVHRKGLLHRAFSVFIFSPDYKKILLQQRHPQKYHSGALWSNTACGHPVFGQEITLAARQRLKEEMGFDTELKKAFVFHYQARLDNDMIENEIDHVFFGIYDGEISPDPDEVVDYKWVNIEDLIDDVEKNPHNYTYWFRQILPRLLDFIENTANQRNS